MNNPFLSSPLFEVIDQAVKQALAKRNELQVGKSSIFSSEMPNKELPELLVNQSIFEVIDQPVKGTMNQRLLNFENETSKSRESFMPETPSSVDASDSEIYDSVFEVIDQAVKAEMTRRELKSMELSD